MGYDAQARMDSGRARPRGSLVWVWALVLCVGSAVPALAGTIADRVSETTLANGLKVLIVEEPKAPVVTVQIWYKVGSRNEQTGRTGLAHMLEHMMFKGTPKYGPKQFDLLVTRVGGVSNAVTTTDYTGYYEDFAADRVELGLELEADRMANLLIDEKELASERQVVIEERRMRIEDQPTGILGQTMRAVAFQANPYRNPAIGWPSDMLAWTRDDLVQFFRTYYVPNNAILVVVGAVKKETLLPKIQAVFGGIPRRPDPPKVTTEEPPQVGERRVYVRKEAELPVLFAVHHAPNLTHPDSYALQVLAYILGGGESARFYKAAVYEKQLASYAGADYNPVHVAPYIFGFSAYPLPGKTVEEIEQVLYAEVERLIKEPLPDRELQKAKNQIESEFIFAQDSAHNLAEMLGKYESVATWKLLDGFVDGVRKVTAADVQRVAQKYLVKENRTVAILVPVKAVAAPAGAGK
jgi:zinc protease